MEELFLEVGRRYRVHEKGQFAFMYYDITVDEISMTQMAYRSTNLLNIKYTDNKGKVGNLDIIDSEFIVSDMRLLPGNYDYLKSITIVPNMYSNMPKIAPLSGCYGTHNWIDTGQMLISFCKDCNARGWWSRTNQKYEVDDKGTT